MPSTASPLLLVELQASGENSNSWGAKANATLSRMEDGIAGRTPVVLSANYTLTDTQYSANESRAMVLDVSGAGGFNIVIPNRAKVYLVRNASSGIATITTGSGTTVAIAAGSVEWVGSTGANVVFRLSSGALILNNVDNTSDVNKPVSTAQQTALNLKANLASPTFTGTPAAPTAAVGTRTTQVATTAFVLTPSIQSVTTAATVTPTFADDMVIVTAQSTSVNFANPTGTATDGWGIAIRLKDNGVARAITYGTQYRAIGITLPTTTVAGKTMYIGMIFNNADTKWDVISVGQE